MSQAQGILIGKNWFEKQAYKFEATRFGSMCWMLIAQACWGGIAVALALWGEPQMLWSVAIIAFFSAGTNALMIAQAPGKWCVGFFYGSVICSTLIVIWEVLRLMI